MRKNNENKTVECKFEHALERQPIEKEINEEITAYKNKQTKILVKQPR